jgi:hypothetical protein
MTLATAFDGSGTDIIYLTAEYVKFLQSPKGSRCTG